MAAGLILGVVAAGYQIINSMNAADDARRAAAAQAEIERQRSLLAAADTLRDGAEAAGSARARAMASGFDVIGSPYIVAMDSLRKAEADAERIIKYGTQEAEYISNRGRAQARAYQNQAIGQVIGAASTFAGQASARSAATDAKGTG